MSALTQCDRCKGAMPASIANFARVDFQADPSIIAPPQSIVRHDLCLRCTGDFRAFMRNEDVRRHQPIGMARPAEVGE